MFVNIYSNSRLDFSTSTLTQNRAFCPEANESLGLVANCQE